MNQELQTIKEKLSLIERQICYIDPNMPTFQDSMYGIQNRLERVIEQNVLELRKAIERLQDGLQTAYSFAGILGRSATGANGNIQQISASLEAKNKEIVADLKHTLAEIADTIAKDYEQKQKTLTEKLENQIKILENKEEENNKELNRLGKNVFKMGNLFESSRENLQKSMEAFQKGLEMLQQEKAKYEQQQKAIPEAVKARELKIAKDIITFADSLDAGIEAGEHIVASFPKKAKVLFWTVPLNQEASLKSWLDGMKLLHQRVLNLLKSLDVEPIQSVGQNFDAKFHCAIGVKKGTDNIIIEDVTRGYKTSDHILRYAEVIVGKKDIETKN